MIGTNRGNKNYKSNPSINFSLSDEVDKMSLSKVSPFYTSAPSMFTDSQPKTGIDLFPFL